MSVQLQYRRADSHEVVRSFVDLRDLGRLRVPARGDTVSFPGDPFIGPTTVLGNLIEEYRVDRVSWYHWANEYEAPYAHSDNPLRLLREFDTLVVVWLSRI